jgi:hypothetical protein
MTNMEALDMAAAAGVDTIAVINDDSNANDVHNPTPSVRLDSMHKNRGQPPISANFRLPSGTRSIRELFDTIAISKVHTDR